MSTPRVQITISYRREDSEAITGRIFDRLATHYGREAVFRDIDSIPASVNFREYLNDVLEHSDIVLAIVGPRWIGARRGQSRLADENDFVRIEVEAALRKRVPLIPVFVMKARMPQRDQLPESLKNFADHNGIQVDAGQDFDMHMSRLITAMDRILEQKIVASTHGTTAEERPKAEGKRPASEAQRKGEETGLITRQEPEHLKLGRTWILIVTAIGALILISGLALYIFFHPPQTDACNPGVKGSATVYFQFAGFTADEADKVREFLSKRGWKMPGQELTKNAMNTNVIRFYPKDKKTAECLKADADAALQAQGYSITLTLEPNPNVKEGIPEIWIYQR